MFVIFYLTLHYKTISRDRMYRPKQAESTARNKFNQTHESIERIIRHGDRNGYNADEYSDEATSHRQTTLRMTCGYAGNR